MLLQQIERAAKQGVIDLSAPPSPEAPEPTPAARPRIEPVALARPKAEPAPKPAPAPSAPADLAGLDHSQIFATTVFDRDKPRSAKPAPEAAPECLPDESLDVAHWSRSGSLFDQVPGLELRLVGEFDTPDPTALGDLARLYIRFGFGAEAEGLLLGFDAPCPNARPCSTWRASSMASRSPRTARSRSAPPAPAAMRCGSRSVARSRPGATRTSSPLSWPPSPNCRPTCVLCSGLPWCCVWSMPISRDRPGRSRI